MATKPKAPSKSSKSTVKKAAAKAKPAAKKAAAQPKSAPKAASKDSRPAITTTVRKPSGFLLTVKQSVESFAKKVTPEALLPKAAKRKRK